MRAFIIVSALILMVTQLPAEDLFTFPIHETKLPNGFTVIAVPMDTPGILAYYTVVRTGSRNEPEKGKTGFAHFFEHMMFRGTDRFPEQAYNQILKEMGADSNAYTSDDETVYHITGSSDYLETLMDIESDRFQNLKYAEEEFKKEAGAVLGEYRKSQANPFLSLYEAMLGTAYTTHTYRHTTMGFFDDILDMPNQYDHSIDFFRRYYRPENCILIVAGDVQPETVVSLAKKYYGPWKKGYDPKPVPEEPVQKEERRTTVDWDLPTNPYLFIGYHCPVFDPADPRSASLAVISELLFASNAPLYQELVVEKQQVEFVSAWSGMQRDPGLFSVITRLHDASNLEAVENRIRTSLENLAKDGVDAADLKKVKSYLRYDFAGGLTTPDAVASALVRFIVPTGSWKSLNTYYKTLDHLSTAEVIKTAGDIFKATNCTIVTLKERSTP